MQLCAHSSKPFDANYLTSIRDKSFWDTDFEDVTDVFRIFTNLSVSSASSVYSLKRGLLNYPQEEIQHKIIAFLWTFPVDRMTGACHYTRCTLWTQRRTHSRMFFRPQRAFLSSDESDRHIPFLERFPPICVCMI